jgi:hypothetical protein
LNLSPIKENFMRTGLNRVLLTGACITLMTCLSPAAWAQAEEEAVEFEVVVIDDAPVATATAAPAPAEEAAAPVEVEIVAQAVTPPIAVEGEEGAAPRETAARLLLQIADQHVPRVVVTQPSADVQYQALILNGDPAARAVWTVAPQAAMLFPRAYTHQPQVLRLFQPAEGSEGGAVAFYYDAVTGEQLTGEDFSYEVHSYEGQWEPGEYMIGVSLSEIDSELVRQHLGIDAEVGLVVDEVFEGSPAQSAGLAVGDILLKAGETELKVRVDSVGREEDDRDHADDASGTARIRPGSARGQQHCLASSSRSECQSGL